MAHLIDPVHFARDAPRILFVPVSGAYGMGEYARCLQIAHGVMGRWPAAAVHFVLSREAPYAAQAPFPVTLLGSSPTFHSAAIVAVIKEFRPNIVIFDNAGRTTQLRAANAFGARVIYISARKRQRNKAFRWRWLRMIDEHWIAYPEFIAGKLRLVEKFKLKLSPRPTVRYLDVILAAAAPSPRGTIRSRGAWEPGTYVLLVPGGGTGHPRARDAAAQFHEAARSLAASGVAALFVGPPRLPSDAANPGLHALGLLPQADLLDLMAAARLIVTNGGDTMLQAIACAVPCVAVAIAKDQPERIRRCAAAGAVIAAPLHGAQIVRVATHILHDAAARTALAQGAAALALADGTAVALAAIAGLIGPPQRSAN